MGILGPAASDRQSAAETPQDGRNYRQSGWPDWGLCDLQSLTRGRRQTEAADRSGVKEGLQRNKRNKELKLGDITSGEEINHSDDQTNSDDSKDQFEGFQCENGLAKSLVLASSDDNSQDSDLSDLHEDNSDSATKKGKRRTEPPGKAGRSPAKKKSALLSMK